MPTFLEAGWTVVPDVLSSDEVTEIAAACTALLSVAEGERFVGDKPFAGTRHLVELDRRIPVVDRALDSDLLLAAVSAFLGAGFERLHVSYRSPQPGFGGQKLHADAVPKFDTGPDLVATAIIPLVPFTVTNGSTRLVPGSHRRPDLQRVAGNLDGHANETMLTGAAGCAFVFSGHVLHSGTRNDSRAERPALQLQWQRA